MNRFDASRIAPGADVTANAAVFRETGLLSPLPLLGSDEVQPVMEVLDTLTRSRGGTLPPILRAKPHLLIPELWRLVTHPVVVSQVGAILGEDLLCFGSSLIWKPAAKELHVSWHQDATHWGLSRPDAVTVWLALTPSTRENGCVLAVPESHGTQLGHDHPEDENNMLGRKEVVRCNIDKRDVFAIELEPGQASIHHALLLHGSELNHSNQDRIGFAMRYIAADNRQQNGVQGTATLVSGRNHGHYDPEQEPGSLMDPAAMRRHAHVLRMGKKIIFGS